MCSHLNRAKNQHYVPQFLLRNFAADRDGRIHAFDKLRERAFITSTRNVAAEVGFYDFEQAGTARTLEPHLTDFESAASHVFSGILERDSIGHLTPRDRALVSMFAAIQVLRVKTNRDRIQSLNSSLRAELAKRGIDPGDVVPEMDTQEVKVASILNIPRRAKELAKLFYQKVWILHRAPTGCSFLISDSPITLHNVIERPGRGNLGLKSTGVEVYLPISSQYSLCFLCRQTLQAIAQGQRTATALKQHFAMVIPDVTTLDAVIEAIATGNPDLLLPDNVVHQNSLQVIFSSRFVFSGQGDFELVRSMLRDNPGLKEAPRLVVR